MATGLQNYVVLDFEGTPTNPSQSSYVVVENGKIVSTYNRLGALEAKAVKQLLELKQTHFFIAHRHATELTFLREQHPYPAPQHSHVQYPPQAKWGPWLDTWLLGGRYLKLTSLELGNVINSLGLQDNLTFLAKPYVLNGTYHNALYDCLGTHLVYQHFLTTLSSIELQQNVIH